MLRVWHSSCTLFFSFCSLFVISDGGSAEIWDESWLRSGFSRNSSNFDRLYLRAQVDFFNNFWFFVKIRPSSRRYADLEGLFVNFEPPLRGISTIANRKMTSPTPTQGGKTHWYGLMRPNSRRYADLDSLFVYFYPPPNAKPSIANPKIHFHIPTMVRRRIYREHQVSDCLQIFFSIQFHTCTLLKKICGTPKFAVISQKKITKKICNLFPGASAHLYGARDVVT